MHREILFIQGGGGSADHEADAKLVHSLREALGGNYRVHYPLLPNESAPDFGRKNQIGRALSRLQGRIILVAHSLGASMLLKYLSESEVDQEIAGIFLLATPFWSGEEDWKQALKLQEDFADKLPENASMFLYHCRDDAEIPYDHLLHYRQRLPRATFRELARGGHQFNVDLSLVAADIKTL